MEINQLILLAAVIGSGVGSTAENATASSFVVSFEGEKAGVQNTTATFSAGGTETFDGLSAQSYPQSFTTNFGTSGAESTITGTYTAGGSRGIQINPADQYGGAGGTGNYIVAFQNTPYSLALKSNVAGGVNYFGFWLSALDVGNFVTFYGANGQTLFTFNPKDVINAINKSTDPGQYYGNPASPWRADGGEPFVFVNFFDTTGSFSKVSFSEQGFDGGYESDNHTVGRYLTMGEGTNVALNFSVSTPQSLSAVPEPSTWAMMLLGFVGVAFASYRRSRSILANAA